MTSPNADLVAEARSYLGVRWRHQGRTRAGVDCAGLVVLVGETRRGMRFVLPDYSTVSHDETMLNVCRENLAEVPRVDMRPGDVVVLRFDRQRHIAMIGDYPAGGFSLIHALITSRKVVEARLDSMWSQRIVAVFRFPEE